MYQYDKDYVQTSWSINCLLLKEVILLYPDFHLAYLHLYFVLQ